MNIVVHLLQNLQTEPAKLQHRYEHMNTQHMDTQHMDTWSTGDFTHNSLQL